VTAMSVSLGSKNIGDIVKLNESGIAAGYVILHKGSPSSLYDGFEGGVLVIRKDIYSVGHWNNTSDSDYQNSSLHNWLNNDYLNIIDAGIRNRIKQVKIPYRPGSGIGTTINSGISGLQCKSFLLSMREVGFNGVTYMIDDGTVLDYFTGISTNSADVKRIANFNGVSTEWWLRTPSTASTTSVFHVDNTGSSYTANPNPGIYNYGFRPAFVLPDTLLVESDGTITGDDSGGVYPGVDVHLLPGQAIGITDNVSSNEVTIYGKSATDTDIGVAQAATLQESIAGLATGKYVQAGHMPSILNALMPSGNGNGSGPSDFMGVVEVILVSGTWHPTKAGKHLIIGTGGGGGVPDGIMATSGSGAVVSVLADLSTEDNVLITIGAAGNTTKGGDTSFDINSKIAVAGGGKMYNVPFVPATYSLPSVGDEILSVNGWAGSTGPYLPNDAPGNRGTGKFFSAGAPNNPIYAQAGSVLVIY